jgi:hypothetical protein
VQDQKTLSSNNPIDSAGHSWDTSEVLFLVVLSKHLPFPAALAANVIA